MAPVVGTWYPVGHGHFLAVLVLLTSHHLLLVFTVVHQSANQNLNTAEFVALAVLVQVVCPAVHAEVTLALFPH